MTVLPLEGRRFLADLAVNNDRAWFEAHRADFTRFVQEPLRALAATLAPTMAALDPLIETDPRRGVVSRIHRDTRFSADKSPYRTRMWVGFKRPGKDWPARPAFFIEATAEDSRHGMGFYSASPATMRALRAAAQARPETFAAALEAATAAGFRIEGQEYARPRLPDGLPPVVAPLFRLKSVHVERAEGDIADGFRSLAPLYERLLAACP
ncbi:DUF2461 domain-containing protein [Novispirillum sp. DQ9]|uniref:DUF2461 domain-containing protein n=1 Tax=Novispirillum sp. DQ9 TaxID=3398612 RepID=UPI003C7ECC82